MKVLFILAKTLEKQKLNFSCSALFHMKTRASFKYFVNECLRIFFPSISPQTNYKLQTRPTNLISLTPLVTARPFTQFESKIRAIKKQKSADIIPIW